MGRAYEVRKASIQKTGAIKAKTYSLFSKEIYLAAKGNPDPDTNINLSRLITKAKKNQVPSDIIDRAIAKAKGSSGDDYFTIYYEVFGPGDSTLIIKCLSDNVNRTISLIRAALNKTNSKLGITNSVAYNYDNLGILSIKNNDNEKILDALITAEIDVIDFEEEEEYLTISVAPQYFFELKNVIENILPAIEYEVDEIGYYAKNQTTLDGDNQILFNRLLDLLDEIDDVSEVYHNVNLTK